jgi:hypothetical protein
VAGSDDPISSPLGVSPKMYPQPGPGRRGKALRRIWSHKLVNFDRARRTGNYQTSNEGSVTGDRFARHRSLSPLPTLLPYPHREVGSLVCPGERSSPLNSMRLAYETRATVDQHIGKTSREIVGDLAMKSDRKVDHFRSSVERMDNVVRELIRTVSTPIPACRRGSPGWKAAT